MSYIPPQNHLLAALPPDVLARVKPWFGPVILGHHEILSTAYSTIDAVYFIESGSVSMVLPMHERAIAEVGVIGNEGMVGISLILGVPSGIEDAVVHSAGTALRMDANSFQNAMAREPIFYKRLQHYREAVHAQTVRLVACNGHHRLEQRLARRLLLACDQAESNTLQITQDYLSLMLCVHRPSMTIAVQSFQHAGLIKTGRGWITVIDRKRLEATACDCYRIVRRRYAQLLGPTKQAA